jgi:hypothetical protein
MAGFDELLRWLRLCGDPGGSTGGQGRLRIGEIEAKCQRPSAEGCRIAGYELGAGRRDRGNKFAAKS